MTLHAVTVPKWGLAMEEGKVVGWLIAEGETVSAGSDLVEIETSKIANVVEAPADGTLRRIVTRKDDVRPVGALLAVIADDEAADAEIDAFVENFEARFEREGPAEEAKVEPETVTAGGHRFRFLKTEPTGEDPTGLPVVLIHGFGGDLNNWIFMQPDLAQDRAVYALDLPGHGGSDKDVGDGSLAAMAERVGQWLDEIGAPQVHLVAHSMGAAVAAELTLARPGQIASLTAICGAGFGPLHNRDYIEGFIAAAKRRDLKPYVQMLFADSELVTRNMLEDLMAYKRLDGVDEALRRLADNALSETSLHAVEGRIAEIEVPVLTLFGEQDRIVAARPARGLSRVITIPDAGHMPHLEAAGEVGALIAAHLEKAEAGR